MLKKIILLIFIIITVTWSFQTKLFDKYYPIHKFKLDNNISLYTYFDEARNIDFENINELDNYSFNYICDNPYLYKEINNDKSEALVILYDKLKISFYTSIINSCNNRDIISKYEVIDNNNELLLNIDKYLIFIDENLLRPKYFKNYLNTLCSRDDVNYILTNNNISYILIIDTFEDYNMANITLINTCNINLDF